MKSFEVRGMSCQGCVKSVEKVLSALDGIRSVTVDLESGKVDVDGTFESMRVVKAIEDAGFSAREL